MIVTGRPSRRALVNWGVLACTAVLVACPDPDPIVDDTFDGNVVIGDAVIKDAVSDSGFVDSEGDIGFVDASDAGRRDGQLRETGVDAAEDDTGVMECNEAPQAMLTAPQAIARNAEFEGMVVDITATATVVVLSCTELQCSDKNPCCNSCDGEVLLDGLIEILPNSCFAAPGCDGTNCDVICMPTTLPVQRTYRGRLRSNGLELHNVF